MSGIKYCKECQATELTKFHSLKDENLVVNPLKKGSKHIKTIEEEENICEEETSIKINLSEAIKMMAKIFYKREHVEKEASIYDLNEILKGFFDQLYLAARPLERNEQTIEYMKKLIVFIYYLLSSLNNTRINAFKSDLAYYLDSVGTSNEGLNTMVNLGTSITSRAVNCKKRRMSNVHGEYVERAFANHLANALVLNIDNYHYIHVLRKPDLTSTSWNREDSEFQQHFVTSKKYPYTPKQLNTLSQKCATKLLDMFAKIYQVCHRHPSIIQTSSDSINTYKLPSLGKKSIKDDSKNIVKDNSKIDEMMDDSKTVEDSLEHATELFLKS
ncbi:8450_t:CDS:2 [Gigaspora margarita]|uniref:8450_t:CDS:1 n=1 Tax=Gigaspora margarita TaxID=4874 RepID=A0ABN7VY15_GIGMA|nr:8450_t:CDS:2 [Gigaspora margarita]